MESIFNKKAVKSLFKAPKGQKSPPPPPINSILRGFILFVLLMGIPVYKSLAQDATVSILGSRSNVGFTAESGSNVEINLLQLSAMQSKPVPFRVCFTSSFTTPSFSVFSGLTSITLTSGCYDDIISANEVNSPPFGVQAIQNDAIDEPNEIVTLTFTDDPDNTRPAGVAEINVSTTVTIRDDDPTVVSLTRTGIGVVNEGGTVEFTVTLGRALVSVPNEIIDVPLIVSGTNITIADWSLAAKTGDALNTGITLINETTAAPVVRFTGAGAQTATLILTASADNTPEGGSETLTLALGPDDETANGFDLNTRMTNVGGGADPDGTKNAFTVTINDKDTEAPMPSKRLLDTIPVQCELTKTQLDNMAPTATDNHPGTVTVTNNIGKFPITSDTTITWTYTDASNNTATQTQAVTIKDTMSPVPNPSNDLSTLTAACSIPAADVTIPTAMDNCDGRIMATTTITPPITASTTIMWTYTDAVGNTATQTQQVTIADNVPPTPNLSNDLSEIMRQCPLGESELTTPAATDNCSGSVTVTNDVTSFPIMESMMITWTYTDGANNTVTQTQQVTIRDNTNPVPAAADLPTLEDCSQITSLNAPNATDNCDGTITAATNASPPITASTTLTWTYTDDANNTTMQTQEVIIGDTEAPLSDNSDLPMLTGECPVAAIADLTAPTATDNCDNGTITATTDAIFPITSTTTITWTYTDAASNTATQTQEVICPLSTADDKAEALIFPNPSGDYLEVRSAIGGTFQLLSLSGKSLLEGSTNTRVDITSLQSGLYLVQLSDGRLLRFVRE